MINDVVKSYCEKTVLKTLQLEFNINHKLYDHKYKLSQKAWSMLSIYKLLLRTGHFLTKEQLKFVTNRQTYTQTCRQADR